MRTGELARQAGVNIQTVRFYERERLLDPPPRTPAGYRRYSADDLERVVFIKTCQWLAGRHPVAGAAVRPDDAGRRRAPGIAERLKIAAIARERLRLKPRHKESSEP